MECELKKLKIAEFELGISDLHYSKSTACGCSNLWLILAAMHFGVAILENPGGLDVVFVFFNQQFREFLWFHLTMFFQWFSKAVEHSLNEGKTN